MSLKKIILSICLVLLMAVPSTTQVAAEQEDLTVRITQVDNSSFPQVTVYVSVSDASGEPVSVEADRIQIYEDGVLVDVEKSIGAGEIRPLTTLLIMDVSGSMLNGGKLDTAKVAAGAYVAEMQTGDRAGLLSFNTKVTTVQEVTADRQKLQEAIENLTARGDTAMYDALLQGVQILAGETGRKAIIVLTDGLDNRSTTRAKDVIAAVGPGGLSISTIGLGDLAAGKSIDGLDEAGLRSLANKAGGQYSFATDTASLQAIYELTGRSLHSEYALTYTSPATLRDGVNRNLTVALANSEQPAQTSYNPGGVLPEVAQGSWLLFGGSLTGLLILAVAPGFLQRSSEKRAKKKDEEKKISRIKLK